MRSYIVKAGVAACFKDAEEEEACGVRRVRKAFTTGMKTSHGVPAMRVAQIITSTLATMLRA